MNKGVERKHIVSDLFSLSLIPPSTVVAGTDSHTHDNYMNRARLFVACHPTKRVKFENQSPLNKVLVITLRNYSRLLSAQWHSPLKRCKSPITAPTQAIFLDHTVVMAGLAHRAIAIDSWVRDGALLQAAPCIKGACLLPLVVIIVAVSHPEEAGPISLSSDPLFHMTHVLDAANRVIGFQ